uniref:Uncharacterized protein n=1 Tax=Arundo donax TaxID=35708 RepID=A0A0A9FBA3_ARUDO
MAPSTLLNSSMI